jgi:hypothetical protein
MIQLLLDDDGKKLATIDPLSGSAGIANFGGFALTELANQGVGNLE